MRFRTLLLLLLSAHAAFSQSSGLIATYSDGKTHVNMVVPAPEFYLEPDESVHPALARPFEAEWTGLLSIAQAGDYTFDAGQAALTIDGSSAGSQPLSLTAGRHAFGMRYRRAAGAAALQLRWKSAKFPLEPVPASVFFHVPVNGSDDLDARVERGRYLIEELGCVNCHRSKSTSLHGRKGPDLTALGSRVTPEWLPKWLESPWAFRPGAVMPAVADAQRRRDLASYLSSLRSPSKPREQKVRGNDVGLGGSLFGSIGCASCHQQNGLSLAGMGSKMTASAVAEFLKDPAKTDPGGRMPSLMLSNEEAFQLAAYLTDSRNPAFEQPSTGGDPVRGRALIESEGCIACHTLRDGTPAVNRQSAPALESLSPSGGCLAAHPGPNVPLYQVSPEQRRDLDAFLTWYRAHPDVIPAPTYELRARVRQMRCVNCHQVDGAGPTAALAEATPSLAGIGAKLRTAWLDRVLTGRARVRRWQELRMPDYDPAHARPLTAAFAKAAGVPPGDGAMAAHGSEAQQAQGAGFLGTDPKQKGMGCIGCHDWGTHKSLGEDGPQLISAAERLRYDWYYRWMLNPARILSGTSMPNYFSSMDRQNADTIINSLWSAMTLGARMPVPAGFGATDTSRDPEARPTPGSAPIVVRWDMPEATPAAIAVGMPGKLSYCFDASESRLRYAWRGGFIDLSETLTKKTDKNHLTPTATLIGDVFYRSEGFPIRVGEPGRVPQRRYRGYRLVDGFPEFRYDVDGIGVTERILPAADSSGIRREFTIATVDRPMWFIDAQTKQKIEIGRGRQVRFTVQVAAGEKK
jgi:mono/diheme cytochrome c family protein